MHVVAEVPLGDTAVQEVDLEEGEIKERIPTHGLLPVCPSVCSIRMSPVTTDTDAPAETRCHNVSPYAPP